MERLVLWDVDGTLVRCGEVGAAVFDRAIEHVVGRRPPARVQMSGKTDPQIVAEYLEMLARPVPPWLPGDGTWVPDELSGAVLARLQVELAAAADEVRAGRVLPGVPEVLARLHGDPDTVQTVLTGNLAANAAVKLGAFGLLQWLDLGIGAFGSDHVERTRLVPVALRRVADRFGAHPAPGRVWVVGDAPNDLAAARAAGARCLLVGTGRYPTAALAALGPDAVLPDLADTERVTDILCATTTGPG